MRTLVRVIGVVVAVGAAFVLIAQGFGAVELFPVDKAKAQPTRRAVPIQTPTALAALGPFEEGPDGIKMPVAEAVTGLTEKEVAEGYELAKKLLTVAHLDPGVLYQGKTEPYAQLLAEHQRDQFVKGLKNETTTTRDEVTAFVVGTSQKAEPIRVRGRAEPKADTVTGSDGKSYQGIIVKIDFEFVYPLNTGEVTEERQGELFVTKSGKDAKSAKVEVWTGQWKGVIHGATCETTDGFLRPATPEALCTRPSA